VEGQQGPAAEACRAAARPLLIINDFKRIVSTQNGIANLRSPSTSEVNPSDLEAAV
jgi:hypothetical protein